MRNRNLRKIASGIELEPVGRSPKDDKNIKTDNRDFHADRQNQKWVADISYIKTAQGFLYLSVIRDLYDRSIVHYKCENESAKKIKNDR